MRGKTKNLLRRNMHKKRRVLELHKTKKERNLFLDRNFSFDNTFQLKWFFFYFILNNSLIDIVNLSLSFLFHFQKPFDSVVYYCCWFFVFVFIFVFRFGENTSIVCVYCITYNGNGIRILNVHIFESTLYV